MDNPPHPNTQHLMSAVPDPDRAGTFDPVERGRQRSAVLRATTCPFDGDPDRPCSTSSAVRHTVGNPANRHWVRCHLYRPSAELAARALAVNSETDNDTE
jgi:peptide/nickel transport system ATP-binding protein